MTHDTAAGPPWSDVPDCYVITVDREPTDIREDTGLALRQAKIRKAQRPGAVVEIHYAPVSYRAVPDPALGLKTELRADLSAVTHLATVKE